MTPLRSHLADVPLLDVIKDSHFERADQRINARLRATGERCRQSSGENAPQSIQVAQQAFRLL